MESAKTSNEPVKQREQIGWCEYKKCGQAAYYRIDFDCDAMNADVCSKHHDEVLALFGLPDCEGDE